MCSARFLGHLYLYICLSTFHRGATYVEQNGVKRFISWDIRFHTQSNRSEIVPRRSTVLGLVPGIQFPLLNAARGDGDWPLHSQIGTSPNWNHRAALLKWLIKMAGAKKWGLIYAKTLASPWSTVPFACFVAESTAEVRSNILSFDQLCYRQPIKLTVHFRFQHGGCSRRQLGLYFFSNKMQSVSNLADGSQLLRVRIRYTATPPRGRVTCVRSPSTFCSEIRKPLFFLLSTVDYYKDRECIHATITRRLYACCSLVLDSHRLSRRSEPCPPNNCAYGWQFVIL